MPAEHHPAGQRRYQLGVGREGADHAVDILDPCRGTEGTHRVGRYRRTHHASPRPLLSAMNVTTSVVKSNGLGLMACRSTLSQPFPARSLERSTSWASAGRP